MDQLELFESGEREKLVPLTTLLRATAERIYQAYPRKKGKFKALQYLVDDLKSGVDPAQILSGVERYAREKQGTEEKFIAMASTFFHQRRWMDYEWHPGLKKKEPIKDPPQELISEAWRRVYGGHAKVPGNWKLIDPHTRAKLIKNHKPLRDWNE